MQDEDDQAAVPLLDPDELRPGDVLLTRAQRQLSRLMAWNAEWPYSHASLVVSRRRVIDAYPPSVRLRPLRALLAEALDVAGVYRPVEAWRRPLPPESRRRIVRAALACLGRPYAGLRLPGLAVRTLLQHKLGWTPGARSRREVDAVICTEVVYRSLRSGIAICLGDRQRRRQPFPRLDLHRMWGEFLGFCRDWRVGRYQRPAQPASGHCRRRLPISTLVACSPPIWFPAPACGYSAAFLAALQARFGTLRTDDGQLAGPLLQIPQCPALTTATGPLPAIANLPRTGEAIIARSTAMPSKRKSGNSGSRSDSKSGSKSGSRSGSRSGGSNR